MFHDLARRNTTILGQELGGGGNKQPVVRELETLPSWTLFLCVVLPACIPELRTEEEGKGRTEEEGKGKSGEFSFFFFFFPPFKKF